MRHILYFSFILVSYPAISFGQVTIDLKALDSLPAARPAPERPSPSRAAPAKPRPAPSFTAESGANMSAGSAPVGRPAGAASGQAAITLSPPSASAPQLPSGPPPAAATESAASVPAPPPPAATANAQSNLRLLFAGAQTDLGPENVAAIKQALAKTAANDVASVNVAAYAATVAEDPSTARRLSLSRALAVRTELIAGGINSSRIYVRALGGQSGDGPPDRVDINIQGGAAGNGAAPAGAR